MENYSDAHMSRLLDIEVLLAPSVKRGIAAVHLGGVAVECRLKALVLIYHNVSIWGETSNRLKDSKRGQPINRTGHGLLETLRLMQDVFKKAKADHLFIIHLNKIAHPSGATCSSFIDLRYSGGSLTDESLESWYLSFKYVIGWLKKNEVLM